MKNKSPEQRIKNEILSYLREKHIFAWPNASTGVYDARKGVFRRNNSIFHLNGVSDILGIYRGKPLAIEVKSLVGRPSANQVDFIKRFTEAGGLAFIARSIEDVTFNLEIFNAARYIEDKTR